MRSVIRWMLALIRGLRGDYPVVRLEDFPDTLEPRTLYAIADAGSAPWAAALLCPCGCKAMVQLALVSGAAPSWRLRIDWLRRPSLHPSVQRITGCRSHFWLARGVVHWVLSTGKFPRSRIHEVDVTGPTRGSRVKGTHSLSQGK